MEPHVHTGVIVFATVTAYWLISYNILRLLVLWLAQHGHETAAATIAGIIPVSVTQ